MGDDLKWLIEQGVILVSVLGGAFLIRGTINFDVNRWLNDRREEKKNRARSLCPHVDMSQNEDGRIQVNSTFVSPSGTLAWECQLCRVNTHDHTWIERNAQYWAEHPKELSDRQDEIKKLLGR